MIRSVSVLGSLLLAAAAIAAEKPVAITFTKLDGKPAPSADVRGKKATVFVFVSFDCPVSTSYYSGLNDLAKARRDKGVSFALVVPADEPPEAIAKQAAEFKLTIPVYLDPKKEAARALGAKTTPEAIVLDADGVVRYRGRIDDAFAARLKKNAAVTSHDLQNALDDLLADKPVRVAQTRAIGCAIDFDIAPTTNNEITYFKQVAPILQKNCQGCHRPGEVGPFALTNFKQARRWAADIAAYTASRQMPPWMPAGGVAMKGERKLTAAEIATLAKWEAAGCPEGDPKDAPAPIDYPDGWRLGKPDLVLSTSEDFHLGPTGDDLFRCFVIPTGLTEDKWIVGYDVKPGNPRIVHHTQHFWDTSGMGRELERKHQIKLDPAAADRGPGYPTSMGVGFLPSGTNKKGAVARVGNVGGWVPGQNLGFLPRGTGWYLPKESDFILFTHFHRDGKPSADRTRIGLYFAKSPIEQPWQMASVNGMKPWEKIPAGKSDHVQRGAVYLHSDAILHGVMPHLHQLGKSVKMTATPPGGKPITLLDVPAWNYRWQESYLFQEAIPVKIGTKLEIEAVFDNSAKGARDVHFGEQTTNEMLYGFFGMTSMKLPFERIQFYAYPPVENGVAAADGEMTPLLESRIGTWDTTLTLKLGEAKPLKLVGQEVVEKTAGGKYTRGKATNEADGRGVITLATFDTVRKAYRLWLFDSQGTVIEFTGIHDAKAKTMTWTATPSAGVTARIVWNFVSDDRSEWSGVVTSGGEKMLEVAATMVRKK
ncbi:MAG TPA: redoxin family protein [Urbifossiella sp.]